MNKSALHRFLALLFVVLSLLAAGWLVHERSSLASRVDTDLFALLPHDERDPQAEAALKALAHQGERQLLVLLEANGTEEAAQAARTWRAALGDAPLQTQTAGLTLESIRDFYLPFRQFLLTPADRARLEHEAPASWFNRALQGAYAPFGTGGLAWQDDPFGWFGNWLTGLGDATRVRPVGDVLMVESESKQYAVLPYTLTGSAFDEAIQQRVQQALDRADRAVRQTGTARILHAGIVLHAAEAMKTAQHEMSVIGLGGMLGIFLLVVLVYRGWRAPVLIVLSLGLGSLFATALTFLVFPRVHVLTLVFGTSLVGVAVDYAIMALTHSLDDTTPPLARYRRLFPALTLAWLTTALAYLGLMLTPFPALAQMAVFAATGITASWLAVILCFPWAAPALLRSGPLAQGFFQIRTDFRPISARWRWCALAIFTLVTLAGLARLQARDDIRAMSGINPVLLQEQISVSRVLSLASPAQMFLISGTSPQAVLEREEALRARLAPFIATGKLSGVDALSRWVPSLSRQQQEAALQQGILQAGLAEQLAAEMGLSAQWVAAQKSPQSGLQFESWLAAPVSLPVRHLWLGQDDRGQYGSLILLKGLHSQQVSAELAKLAGPGVRWIDKPAEISAVMARYRVLLGSLLIATYLATALGLYLRYRQHSWRVLLPPALASIVTLALMGWTAQPLQLLSMVSLLLVLGMGVDYGIFLQEQHHDRRGMLAMLLAMLTSLLSFGLLAFSSTPALYTFGFAAMSGIGLSALFAWLLRKPEAKTI